MLKGVRGRESRDSPEEEWRKEICASAPQETCYRRHLQFHTPDVSFIAGVPLRFGEEGQHSCSSHPGFDHDLVHVKLEHRNIENGLCALSGVLQTQVLGSGLFSWLLPGGVGLIGVLVQLRS